MSARRWLPVHTIAGLILLINQATPASAQVAEDGNKPAAEVNGEIIRFAEVDALVGARPVLPLPRAQKIELYKSALEMLIDDMLIRQFLRKNASAPAAAEIEKEWKELNDALAKKKQSLPEFLRESKQTEQQLRADIAARVQWRAYVAARYNEAELQAYYQANKLFFDKTFVQASHILRKAGQDPKERNAAKQSLEVLRQDIVNKKISFEDAARKYSECPSKTEGGDIGKFPYKFVVVEPFAKTAFAMKVGDVSDVVATEFGMHLIKVTNRFEGSPSNFQEVRETVRETYAQETGLYKHILADQRSKAKIVRSTIEVLLK
jgi:parvulin-like peptidyl-prolyl isomerase